MISYPDVFSLDRTEEKISPTGDAFTKVLDRAKLIAYWKKNRSSILTRQFHLMEKEIITSNHKLSYQNDIAEVFRTLDQLEAEIREDV